MPKASHIIPIFAYLAAAGILACCGTITQTTSGKEYLSAFPSAPSTAAANDIDSKLRQVADVEPLLHFPARIGLAHIGGQSGHAGLGSPPPDEAKVWSEAIQRLGPSFGVFVPVSPLIAAMEQPRPANERSDYTHGVVESIRLAAARQHLDAVILYEVDATADSKNNPLSIADWTLIGAFVLPSQDVKAEGFAQAIMLDVRNGYHYGTVQTTSDDKVIAARFSNQEAMKSLSERVKTVAVEKLAKETEEMLRTLRAELAEKREKGS